MKFIISRHLLQPVKRLAHILLAGSILMSTHFAVMFAQLYVYDIVRSVSCNKLIH
jgi:hypothetical protein